MTTVITGANIEAYRLLTLTGALRLYLHTGMKPNRMYTPANMRKAATYFTGTEYPRSRKGLEQASHDLEQLRAELLASRRASVMGAN